MENKETAPANKQGCNKERLPLKTVFPPNGNKHEILAKHSDAGLEEDTKVEFQRVSIIYRILPHRSELLLQRE